MSAAEIKQTKLDLMAWIEQLSDVNTLAVLESFKNSRVEGDWWNELSEEEKRHIEAGQADVKAGRVMTSEEFWRKVKNG